MLLLIPGVSATQSRHPGISWDRWHCEAGGIWGEKAAVLVCAAQRAWGAAPEGQRAFLRAFLRGFFGNSTGQVQVFPADPFRIQILQGHRCLRGRFCPLCSRSSAAQLSTSPGSPGSQPLTNPCWNQISLGRDWGWIQPGWRGSCDCIPRCWKRLEQGWDPSQAAATGACLCCGEKWLSEPASDLPGTP